MGVQFDFPKLAYETWAVFCYSYDENGKRYADYEREDGLAKSLQQYKYSDAHKHIRYPKQ